MCPDLSLDDYDVVPFTGKPPVGAPGEFIPQRGKDEKVFGRPLEAVKEDWKKLSAQIAEMVKATSPIGAAGYSVESIEIGLAFSASGKLAFIAEAGVEASVNVTLSRSPENRLGESEVERSEHPDVPAPTPR